jgi:plasmid stabilization system protein ParE
MTDISSRRAADDLHELGHHTKRHRTVAEAVELADHITQHLLP